MSDIVLASGGSRLAVARLGAEARAWSVGGVELLWPGDPAIWADISPILFPIVGWTRDGVRIGGRRYDMEVHGFARRLTFNIETSSPDAVRLLARDDESTRASYPFPFALRVEHRLTQWAWEVTLEIENTGASAMPYACGLHPGFNWPFGGAERDGALIRFARPERDEVPIVAPGGLISQEMRAVPLSGVELPLDDALFAREALCFLEAASRSLRFEQADGSALEVVAEGFPHFALWTKSLAPLLSIETWTGYGDPPEFQGDLFEKPSISVLDAGRSARCRAIYRYQPAARLPD